MPPLILPVASGERGFPNPILDRPLNTKHDMETPYKGQICRNEYCLDVLFVAANLTFDIPYSDLLCGIKIFT